ncbi:MAG: inositol monophosphatase family protein [Actinomycetota bacterium]
MGEREDLERYREVAARAALAAGRVILDSPMPEAERKGRADYVTAVDRRAEEAVREVLGKETPGLSVVGEELGGHETDEYWLVDPLDGTTNFLHRFPAVGVSVALVAGGRPTAAAVHAPYLATTWTAARGQGAEQDGAPLRVSDASPEEAVVGTGFPFRFKEERLDEYLGLMIPALRSFEDLRRPGAVALDLAWVASGVFDGFFELALSSWDVAAGALLIEEAGGLVTDWSGGDDYLSGDILAGNSLVHAALVELARAVATAKS